jgi:hypothetical protein
LFLCIFFLFWCLSTVFNFFFSMLNTNWLMIGNIGNRILVGQFYKWIEYAIICIFLKSWSISFTHISVSLSFTNPSAQFLYYFCFVKKMDFYKDIALCIWIFLCWNFNFLLALFLFQI